MKAGKWILAFLVVALAAALGVALLLSSGEDATIDNAGKTLSVAPEQISLTYQNQEYPLKENLNTILLIGTDGTERYEEKEGVLQDYYNFDQADFLVLLVQNTEENTTEVIQLNRDTMTEVPWLDVIGNYGGTEFKQLCLAFNSGDGGRASCLNTVDAVSMLLFDAPIQHYIQIPMSAIPVLNDLVGGVPVEILEDLTAVDPAFVEGNTIYLNGEQAEKFVRARMILDNDTNEARMSRQRIYLDGFRKQAKEALHAESEFSLKLVEKLGDYMQTDLTIQQLTDLVQSLDTSRISPIRIPEGELLVGTEYYEFFADEASLWKIVKQAYCQ